MLLHSCSGEQRSWIRRSGVATVKETMLRTACVSENSEKTNSQRNTRCQPETVDEGLALVYLHGLRNMSCVASVPKADRHDEHM